MHKMASNAGLTGRKTNHSLRKTLCSPCWCCSYKHYSAFWAYKCQQHWHRHRRICDSVHLTTTKMCSLLQNLTNSLAIAKPTLTTSRSSHVSTSLSSILRSNTSRTGTSSTSSLNYENLATGSTFQVFANVSGGTFNISLLKHFSSQSQYISSEEIS